MYRWPNVNRDRVTIGRVILFSGEGIEGRVNVHFLDYAEDVGSAHVLHIATTQRLFSAGGCRYFKVHLEVVHTTKDRNNAI